MNVDRNMQVKNITKEENIGVILSKRYCFLSKSPLNDSPIKLKVPSNTIIKIIYISPAMALLYTICFLFIGRLFKYSIV